MNVDSMNNGSTSVEHSPTEQYPSVNNQQGGNSTQNQPSSEIIVNVTKQVMMSPMTPTPLYISFFCLNYRNV